MPSYRSMVEVRSCSSSFIDIVPNYRNGVSRKSSLHISVLPYAQIDAPFFDNFNPNYLLNQKI